MVIKSFPCLLCHKLKLTSLIFLTEINIHLLKCYLNFCLPKWQSGKELTWQCRRRRRCGFDPWLGKIPCKRKWQPTPVFLLGKFHGQRSLVGHSPWGCKRVRRDLANKQQQQWETFVWILFLGNPMDRGVWWATVHGVAKSWTRLSTHTHNIFRVARIFLYHLRG